MRLFVIFSLFVQSIFLYADEPQKNIFKNSNDHVLKETEWKKVQASIDKGLKWLSRMQASDGSFSGQSNYQPAITSFAVMAYMAAGHQPGKGKYGKILERAIEYTLSCQTDEGIFTRNPIPSTLIWESPSHTSTYTHAITGVMLAECYGQAKNELNVKIYKALKKGLKFTIKHHHANKRAENPEDKGGWRYSYISPTRADADLSVTGWHLMFLRSAHSAGFEIPESEIDITMEYVKRCFVAKRKEFSYTALNHNYSSAMTGAGALCLALAGLHDHEAAKKSGEWLMNFNYNKLPYYYGGENRVWPYYAAYYCSQAASQLGGEVWKKVYPKITSFLLANQTSSGYWSNRWSARAAGNCYSTSLAILSLSTQHQLLPIVQR